MPKIYALFTNILADMRVLSFCHMILTFLKRFFSIILNMFRKSNKVYKVYENCKKFVVCVCIETEKLK